MNNWMRQVIKLELCKISKFYPDGKWYIQNQKLSWKTKCTQYFWAFEHNQGQKKLRLTRKQKLSLCGFCESCASQRENKRKRKKKKNNKKTKTKKTKQKQANIRILLSADKAMEHESDAYMNCSSCAWNHSQSLRKESRKTIRSEEEHKTIQITTLLSSARILRRVLKTWDDLLSINFQWKKNPHQNGSEKLPENEMIRMLEITTGYRADNFCFLFRISASHNLNLFFYFSLVKVILYNC